MEGAGSERRAKQPKKSSLKLPTGPVEEIKYIDRYDLNADGVVDTRSTSRASSV